VFKPLPFRLGRESVKADLIFPHVRVNEKGYLHPVLREGIISGEGDIHQISNTPHVEDDFIHPFIHERSS